MEYKFRLVLGIRGSTPWRKRPWNNAWQTYGKGHCLRNISSTS